MKLAVRDRPYNESWIFEDRYLHEYKSSIGLGMGLSSHFLLPCQASESTFLCSIYLKYTHPPNRNTQAGADSPANIHQFPFENKHIQ